MTDRQTNFINYVLVLSRVETFSFQIHIKPGTSSERIEAIKREFGRIYLKELIKKFTIDERVNLHEK